jgi:hypothetical protein
MKAMRPLRRFAATAAVLVGGLASVVHPVAAQQPAGGAAGAQLPAVPPDVASCPAPAPIIGDFHEPMAAVRYLADDALEGRLSGTPGERCAADYIASEFARIGLRPAGDAGGYLQAVGLQSIVNPHAPGGTGTNVIGILEGSDPALRDQYVVLGAHHDHLGHGEIYGSLAGPEDAGDDIHNGADDNASGVGALIEVAEALSADPPARSVLFITFTGEEWGLLGSAFFVEHPSVPLDRIDAMLNMDMVGRLGDQSLIVNGTGTAEEWDAILDSIEPRYGIPLARSTEGYGPSDHTSFYAKGISVLHFFTNVHEDYHRPSDEWPLIDQPGLARVADLVEGVVRAVADRPDRLVYLAGAGTPPEEETGGYGAYLGTIPDFAPVDFGVKLSGVSAGGPAEAAGMRGGDILIQLGDFEISDLYALTDALNAIPVGTEVEATFLRDGERMTVSVTLRERP